MNEAAASYQLTTGTATTTIPVSAKRTVCYEFDTRATKADLALPYLVIVNGEVPAGSHPRKLTNVNRKIKVTVDVGSKVSLYLNSDVHPNHRKHPVYEVAVREHNVWIKIRERTGVTVDALPVIGNARTHHEAGAVPTDHYNTFLTGKIWMLISHKYTEEEADGILPTDVNMAIRTAICRMYRGLEAPRLAIQLTEGVTLQVSFLRQENPHANIANCSFLADVLPRTHPLAFAALFSEACIAGVTELHVTSCWRPSLGSISHRAGLGLDVNLLANRQQRVRINRTGTNPTRNDPLLMQKIREGLSKHSAVEQILDPWYIDLNTQDNNAASANELQTDIETLHSTHLHITVQDRHIYE